ncbi:MAG: hypothetical protein K8R85_10350, partial [Bacteroidetes bacterium]|nr:hypothetical protein [Bacteroidota bacterium]
MKKGTTGSTYKMYLNGSALSVGVHSNQTNGDGNVNSTHKLLIGGYESNLGIGNATDFYKGIIHSVKIYGRELTSTEVSSSYNVGCYNEGLLYSNLLFNMRLSTGEGNTLYDRSVNGFTGTMIGTTTWESERLTGSNSCFDGSMFAFCKEGSNGDRYRFGFNGKENDNEVKGQGNQQDYGMRFYDNRLGRFLSIDPLIMQYPELTPYQFASNMPIWAIDRDGLEAWPTTRQWTYDDRARFGEFVNGELARINAAQSDAAVNGGGKRLLVEYNCADLAVALYVRYAAANGLPISFTSGLDGKKISSEDPKYKFDPKNPQKTIDNFEYEARINTSASSLVIYGDAIQIPFVEVGSGDFYDSKSHVMVVRAPFSDDDVGPNQKPVSYGNLATTTGSDP